MHKPPTDFGLNRVTLYKHFWSKNEALFLVNTTILLKSEKEAEQTTVSTRGCYERLRRELRAYAECFCRHNYHFRFVGLFDQYYAYSSPRRNLADQYREDIEPMPRTEVLIGTGTCHGSLPSDTDQHGMSVFIGYVFRATAHHIAAREIILLQAQRLDINYVIDLLITTILTALQGGRR